MLNDLVSGKQPLKEFLSEKFYSNFPQSAISKQTVAELEIAEKALAQINEITTREGKVEYAQRVKSKHIKLYEQNNNEEKQNLDRIKQHLQDLNTLIQKTKNKHIIDGINTIDSHLNEEYKRHNRNIGFNNDGIEHLTNEDDITFFEHRKVLIQHDVEFLKRNIEQYQKLNEENKQVVTEVEDMINDYRLTGPSKSNA